MRSVGLVVKLAFLGILGPRAEPLKGCSDRKVVGCVSGTWVIRVTTEDARGTSRLDWRLLNIYVPKMENHWKFP